MGQAHRLAPTLPKLLRALETRVRDDPAGRLGWWLVKRAVRDCAYIGVKKGKGVTKQQEAEIVESAECWLRNDLVGSRVALRVADALILAGLSELTDDMGVYLADLAVQERCRRQGDC